MSKCSVPYILYLSRYLFGRLKFSVVQLDLRLTGDQEVAGSTPPGLQHFFVDIDHELFSTVILSLSLIQEGQSSLSVERMCAVLVKLLED